MAKNIGLKQLKKSQTYLFPFHFKLKHTSGPTVTWKGITKNSSLILIKKDIYFRRPVQS